MGGNASKEKHFILSNCSENEIIIFIIFTENNIGPLDILTPVFYVFFDALFHNFVFFTLFIQEFD